MVLDLLLIGLGITLEPFPVTAFILVLSAERGTVKDLAFVLGWLGCLVVVITAVILATGNSPVSLLLGFWLAARASTCWSADNV